MVVRADVLATPALLFESDRKKIHLAIDQTQPGAAPLNLQQALDFATQAQKVQAQRPGEIVFVGAGRIPATRPRASMLAANFRLIAIDGPTEHVGLRKVSVHRAMDDPDAWEVFIAAKNYGAVARSVPMIRRVRRIARRHSPLRLEAGRRRGHDLPLQNARRRMVGNARSPQYPRHISVRTAARFSNFRRAASCPSPCILPSRICCGQFSARFPASKPAFFPFRRL